MITSLSNRLVVAGLIAASLCCGAEALACTNLIAGRKATTDGSILVTYADDSHTRFGDLFHSPRGKHAPGSMRQIIDWGSYKPLGEIHRSRKPITW